MLITRPTIVNDDLTGTVGTSMDEAFWDVLLSAIDDAINGRTVQTKIATYTLLESDDIVEFTTAGATLNLPAANSVNKKAFGVINAAASGVVTIDPNGAELIDGVSTLALQPGEAVMFYSTGTAWRTLARKSGAWIAVAHAGGNFTASGTMTWTVESGDQQSFRYRLDGKTLDLTVDMRTSTIGGSVSNELRVALPASLVANGTSYALAVLDQGSGQSIGLAFVTSGATYVSVRKTDETNFALSTNGTRVQFTIRMEVQ